MADASGKAREEARNKLVAHIASQIQVGKSKAQILSDLESSGLERPVAGEAVDAVHQALLRAGEQEQVETRDLVNAAIAAGAAALLGGVLWGLIVRLSDYEWGLMATGIGLLAGYGVTRMTRKRGRALQIIAVIGSLVGVLLGKYFTFYVLLRAYVAQEFGPEVLSRVALLSPATVQVFVESLPDLVSAYDVLWIALAVLAAWRIPKGLGWQPPAIL